MGFLGRVEVVLDSQMNLHAAAFEPASATLGEFGRLLDFVHAKHPGIETACDALSCGGHCQLNMINRKEMVGHLLIVSGAEP